VLRSNPFQVGEDDVILNNNGTKDMNQRESIGLSEITDGSSFQLEMTNGFSFDDVILTNNGIKEMDQVEPELKKVERRTEEQLEPEETNDNDLEVSIGPMTSSKQARFRQAPHQFLHTIQGSLECAYPTTL